MAARSHDIMARINGIVFVHGGPGAEQAAVGCDGTNERARKDIKTYTVNTRNYLQSFLWNAAGALWYRGLVSDPPDAVSDEDVTAVLKSLGASRMVVGHTVSRHRQDQGLAQQPRVPDRRGHVGRRVLSGRPARGARDRQTAPLPRSIWGSAKSSFLHHLAEQALQQIDVICEHAEDRVLIETQRDARLRDDAAAAHRQAGQRG